MPAISLSGQSRQRQIVILGVGGLLLAGLLLFQVPRTLKMLNPDSATQPPPSAEQTGVSPAPVTPVAPAVSVTGTGSPVRAALLTRFRSKDPFVQQINPNAAASGADSESGDAAPASSEAATEPGAFRAVDSPRTAAAARTATIAVNGTEETVAVSNTFPNGNPVFKLVSVGENSAKVGVASGKLGGGAQTVTLSKGEPLTLLNTVDGKRYKLELILVSS
jgi:hypothetical protein